MKKILILLFFVLPLTILGQHLKCCESEKEVEIYLNGIWKKNDSIPEFIHEYKNGVRTKHKIEVFYKYTFENGQGHLTEMMKKDKTDDYQILDDHPFVDIISYDQGFKLKFTSLYNIWTSDLKYLNSNRMILINNGEEIEYIKESE